MNGKQRILLLQMTLGRLILHMYERLHSVALSGKVENTGIVSGILICDRMLELV